MRVRTPTFDELFIVCQGYCALEIGAMMPEFVSAIEPGESYESKIAQEWSPERLNLPTVRASEMYDAGWSIVYHEKFNPEHKDSIAGRAAALCPACTERWQAEQKQ